MSEESRVQNRYDELSESEFEEVSNVMCGKHTEPGTLERLQKAEKRQADARNAVTGGI